MANKPKEYGVAPDSPRTQESANRRIEEMKKAGQGLDIIAFFRLRRLARRVEDGKYHRDRSR